jgi:hypothetical protein
MRQNSILKAYRVIVLATAVWCCLVSGTQAAGIKAKIVDINGKPAEGVKIFLYDSNNVRKPADFISNPSDKNGQVVLKVPAGKYWAVARIKKDVSYGPLMPGDKHSGEPVELECSENMDTELGFEVADILDVGQKKRTNTADFIRLWGRVVDSEGKPLADVYVFAHSSEDIEFVPEYISAWTDESGNYIVYLPSKGSYFVGSSRQFPPKTKPLGLRLVEAETVKLDVATDIQLIVY